MAVTMPRGEEVNESPETSPVVLRIPAGMLAGSPDGQLDVIFPPDTQWEPHPDGKGGRLSIVHGQHRLAS